MKHLFARSSLVFVLSLASAIPAFAETTYRFRKLPPATLRGLAAVPAPPPLPRENRHERRERNPLPERERVLRTDAVTTPLLVTAATIAPPPVAAGFASDSSETLSPADSIGAVSKSHVVSASNAGIVVHSRSGARLAQLTLSQFWRNSNTVAEFYDPRLSYDAAADRWITAAIRNAHSLMLAVSASSDPSGAWTRYQVDINNCDFTRLALTRDTVLLSTIVAGDSFASYSVLFSFDKAALYAGAANPSVRQYNNLSESAYPVDAPDSPVEYVADVTDAALYFKRLDQISQPYGFVEAGFAWTSPGFFGFGPQAGTTNTLDMGFGDLQAAVYRDGWLYAVHRIGSSTITNDDNALLWWKVDPDGVRPGTVGLIDGPAGVFYAYPSLAVSRNGGMLISYCVLSNTTYPSAAYVYRDPAGRVSTQSPIRAGDSPILSTDRWGDYTTVVTDPADDRDFWVAQIYASRNNWQTWWAQVTPAGRSRAARK
jgi:hypothetical protein